MEKEQNAIQSPAWLRWKKAGFIVAALLAVSGAVSASFALIGGIVFALTADNPFPERSKKLSKFLLQASVVGLGFGMNAAAVWHAGKSGFGLTVLMIAGTLLTGIWLGRLLRVDAQTSTLVSVGTSICGGSAIAAVGAVLEADTHAMTVSLCTVFLLNSLALLIFPSLGHLLGMDQTQFGLWAAIAIHDTSSVVGAAAKYGGQALTVATTVKLARALWIFPVVLALTVWKRGRMRTQQMPWFIFAFLAAAVLRSLLPQGAAVYDGIAALAKLGLTLTLFLIGAGLSGAAIRTVGFRPLIQGALLWIAVSVAGLGAVRYYISP